MTRCYRRDGTPYADVFEWARDFEVADRLVAYTVLKDGTRISTVWLGLDRNYSEDGPPLIFETMVFPVGGVWCDQERYTTEEQARLGHERTVKKYREAAT